MIPGSGHARAAVYRLLAHLFQPPDGDRLRTLLSEDAALLDEAFASLAGAQRLAPLWMQVRGELESADPDRLAAAYQSAFEPSAGAERPPNETAFAPRTPQEGLTRTFELADIAGFYRAFGVEVAPETERADHIAVELEFMHLLAIKEAAAAERGEPERVELCREASGAFLRDHLARWCSALRDRLIENRAAGCYVAGARLLAAFVEWDAGSLPAPPARTAASGRHGPARS